MWSRLPPAVLMLAASALFATMSLFVKLASPQHHAGELVFYRGLTGVLMMAVLARWQRVPLATPVWTLHLRRSLSGSLALVCWFVALAGLPLATGVTMNYLSSLWMAAFLALAAMVKGHLKEKLPAVMWVVAGFAGVVMVLRPAAAPAHWVAGLAGLCSGALAAVAYLQVAALGRSGEPAQRTVFYFTLSNVALGGLAMLVWGIRPPWQMSPVDIAQVLAIGVLATLAQLALTEAYARGKALANAALQYTGILFSALLGLLCFGERPDGWSLLGMAVIALAGLGAQGLLAWPRPRSAS